MSETTEQTSSQKLSAARQAATTRLLDAHRDEFNKYMTEEAKARGVEWKRKLTPEERAERELEALLAANPGLASRLQAALPEQPDEAQPERESAPVVPLSSR